MSDVDDGGTQPLVQLLDLGAHVHAQLRVEVRQRLVEQEDTGLAHQRAAHGHALALAAGELRGAAVEQMVDLQRLGDLLHGPLPLRLRDLAHLHAEGDVLLHRHVRIERVGLEHHGDVALARVQVVDAPAADADLALGHGIQPGDHVEQRGLAAAGGADQHQKLARVHADVDALEDVQLAVAFADVEQLERCHAASSSLVQPFTDPVIRPRTK